MIQPATLSPDATATDRFIWVLDFLRLAIAERHRELGGAMTLAVWKRVGHYRRCFLSLAARVLAGEVARIRAPRPTGSRPPPSEPASSGPGPSEPVLHLPAGFAWMCGLVPYRAASHGRQLHHLLTTDAELIALVSSDPRFGRLLRPLLRATGQDCPPCVPPPVPRRRTARPPADPSKAEPKRAPRAVKPVTGRALLKYLPWKKPRPLPRVAGGGARAPGAVPKTTV